MKYGRTCYQEKDNSSESSPGADIPKGTLKAILKEAGIPLEDFLRLLD